MVIELSVEEVDTFVTLGSTYASVVTLKLYTFDSFPKVSTTSASSPRRFVNIWLRWVTPH